jgi:hypothetical protein
LSKYYCVNVSLRLIIRIYFIQYLHFSVGDAIAAFAAQMLKGAVPPGVYFPEEVPGKSYREEILCDISSDAITYTIDLGKGKDGISHTFSMD